MCGFLGEISDLLGPESEFLGLLNLSRKRGPDQQGLWTDHVRCRMGFNRLSIIDVSERGKQPLRSPSGRFALVLNGEIYNYRELRKKYAIPDHALRSQSDSEVLAHLVDHAGIFKVAHELNGMFAIAVYDTDERKLFLFRDFAGIKPLFYGIGSNHFVFASQFDQVFMHPAYRQNLRIDQSGLYDYMALGYMSPPRTVFKRILQVRPGELISIDANGDRTSTDFRKFSANGEGNVHEESEAAANSIDALLDEVVRDQLVSDVPVGLFLSGGIDSPLIAAHAQKFKPDITAYTIGVDDRNMDEAAIASAYASAFGIRHEIISFGQKELLEINDRHFETLTEPFGDYSSLPTYLVTHIARRKNTVMLSGDGGDELFWGYPRFQKAVNHFTWFKYPTPLRNLMSGISRMAGERVSYAVNDYDTIAEWVLARQSYNGSESLASVMPGTTYSEELTGYYAHEGKFDSRESLLQWLRWNEFYGHLQRVLAKVDRTSMGNSLEVRVPFLDLRIIEFAWNLNGGLGIRHQVPKLLLKKSLQQKLGDIKAPGRKKGFGVPIKKWLHDELRGDFEHHVLGMPLFGNQYIDQASWQQAIKGFQRGETGNEWGAWIMYALQKWAARYDLLHVE